MNRDKTHKVVGVICGGYSGERSVSLRSGKNVNDALLRLGYETCMIDPVQNIEDLSKIDVAFLALHGKGGEDGSIQGLLERLGIPYTGSNSSTSALALNKVYTKQCLERHGFDVTPYRVFSSPIQTLPEGFEFPVILKPIDDGSSVGVYVIDTADDLQDKSSRLIQTYNAFILESFVTGREITVGVIDEGVPRAFPILELKSKNRIYDYEAKYTPGMTTLVCPAPFPDDITTRCLKNAEDIFTILGCKGMARIDMFVCDDAILILEVNTLPGMTETSDLPIQAKAAGISFDELVDLILKSAC